MCKWKAAQVLSSQFLLGYMKWTFKVPISLGATQQSVRIGQVRAVNFLEGRPLSVLWYLLSKDALLLLGEGPVETKAHLNF